MQTSTIFFCLRLPDRFRRVSFQILPRIWFDSPDSLPGCNLISVLRSRSHFSPLYYSHLQLRMPFQRKKNSSNLPPFFWLSVHCILDSGPDSRTHAHTYTHTLLFPLGTHLYGGFFPWLRFIFLFQFHLVTYLIQFSRYIWHFLLLPPPKKKVGKSNLKNPSVINREPNSMPCLLTWFALSFFRLDFSHL